MNRLHPVREYAARALLAVAVPQANPVVEAEMNCLMPPNVGLIATRLQGSKTNSSNRLVQYLDNLKQSLDAFDIAPIDALGYACTGTGYLIGQEAERRRIAEHAKRVGYPIVTSTSAILDALSALGARRIALLAPYPKSITNASHDYWRSCGVQIVSAERIDLKTEDTRAVYSVRSSTVAEHAARLLVDDADVILMSGTGMPTLRAIPQVSLATGKPVISSNLCLAWALLKKAGVDFAPPRALAGESLLGGWVERALNL